MPLYYLYIRQGENMKSWSLFVVTLGTILIVAYPISHSMGNLYFGGGLVGLGAIGVFLGRK